MSERITPADVDARAARLSERLHGLRIVPSRRNGATALDLYDDGDRAVRMLTIGTTREVYAYLGAMSEALALVNR